MSLQSLIASRKVDIFRRVKIKRRSSSTGLFESDWLDITKHVKRYGTLKRSIDDIRLNKFRLSGVTLKLENHEGKFNPESYESSYWYGYLARPRTLIKIEAGYKDSLGTEYPTNSTLFTGIIADEMPISDNNEIAMPCKSLLQIFQEFPASSIDKWTVTGWSASDIIGAVRDQTDGSGNYIFQQFITSGGWNIVTTTSTYDQLNTASSKYLKDLNVWDMIEKLAEAENYVALITPTGNFYFTDRSVNTSTSWEFYGLGPGNKDYGHTIKKINKYYEAITKLYQKVSMRYSEEDTSTSWIETQTAMVISPSNTAWIYGTRIYDFENYWASYTQSVNLVSNIYDNYSSLKSEIDFTSILIPHLDILDYAEITFEDYGAGAYLWDACNWDEAYWEGSFDNFQLQASPFKILSIQHNLDKFETRWIMRDT